MTDLSQIESAETSTSSSSLPLSLPEYKRYGRQIILPRFGLTGQIKLQKAKVLVVGAGGLGCPAIQYLAAAGVGHITIIDNDHVESSNLARQILHSDEKVGMNKALSATEAARLINPHIHLEVVEETFSIQNAILLIARHDVVLDCTDNVMTRYLISDAAVLNGVQVVSGAGQGLEGQLVVLHKDLEPGSSASGYSRRKRKATVEHKSRGPCYRCLFPRAPRPEDVTDCEDGGVLGCVTGLVGTMQATEAIKLLVGMSEEEEPPHMILVSPFNYPPFRTVKIRSQRITTCRACGDQDKMKEEDFKSKIQPDLKGEDYFTFCGLNRVAEDTRHLVQANVTQLRDVLQGKKQTLVVDVRPQVEYEIAHISPSINIPFRTLQSEPQSVYDRLTQQKTSKKESKTPIYILCRKGNDSLLAQRLLSSLKSTDITSTLHFINVKGGLRAWSDKIDDKFPVY